MKENVGESFHFIIYVVFKLVYYQLENLIMDVHEYSLI